ncbi:MAG TPA: hypothetical protein VF334_24860 [Polyangia bacterium]
MEAFFMAEDDMVEVFRAADRMGAQAAIDEVLGPLGIEGWVHDRMSHALPAPASMPGGYFVAVPLARASEAVAALRDALTDGAIDGELTAGEA